jgi:C4-type Zn-finger protein
MLSKLLAEHLNVQIPDMQVTNRDAELAEIQRIENINGLLEKLLQAEQPEPEKVAAKKSVKHGAGK